MTATFEQQGLLLSTELLERQVTGWVGLQTGTELRLPNAYTHLVFEMVDGRSERFSLAPMVDMEYVVYDPVATDDGGLVVPLQVLRFENSAVSEVLWPGETLMVKGGVRTHPTARPIHGTVHCPPGRNLEDGVLNRQTLWSRFWTPEGELTMAYPANMSGVVTKIEPPLKARLYADRPIPLYNDGKEHVATIFNCTTAD